MGVWYDLEKLRQRVCRDYDRIFKKKRRVGLILVPYAQADALIKEGWTIAKEEDNNRKIGIVYLEKLE